MENLETKQEEISISNLRSILYSIGIGFSAAGECYFTIGMYGNLVFHETAKYPYFTLASKICMPLFLLLFIVFVICWIMEFKKHNDKKHVLGISFLTVLVSFIAGFIVLGLLDTFQRYIRGLF